MQKIEISDLKQATREHLESETQTLLNRGFRLLGDYKLKGKPLVIHSRLFLDPQSNYFAEVLSLSKNQGFELMGYLEDGTVITTAALAHGSPLATQDLLDTKNYFTELRNDMNLTRLLEDHEARMQAHSQVADSPIQLIQESNWIEFFRYHNRRHGQINFDAGRMDNKPDGVVALPTTGRPPTSNNFANEMSAV